MTFAPHNFAELVGLGEPLLIRRAADLHGRELADVDVANLMQLRLRIYMDRVAELPPVRVGAREFISRLSGAVRLAVASGALQVEGEAGLVASGLRGFFDEVVTIEDVLRGKPDPEAYLVTLARLSARASGPIHPHEVVVFEDSPYGVEAAKAAGMTCIGVRGTVDDNRLGAADLISGDFAEALISEARRRS